MPYLNHLIVTNSSAIVGCNAIVLSKSDFLAPNIKVYRSKFRPLSKSLPKTGSKCILKLIVDKNNNKVLGCHMIGDNASEIIQMASISLMLGAKKSDFDNTMALHPTIAEEFVTMRWFKKALVIRTFS